LTLGSTGIDKVNPRSSTNGSKDAHRGE